MNTEMILDIVKLVAIVSLTVVSIAFFMMRRGWLISPAGFNMGQVSEAPPHLASYLSLVELTAKENLSPQEIESLKERVLNSAAPAEEACQIALQNLQYSGRSAIVPVAKEMIYLTANKLDNAISILQDYSGKLSTPETLDKRQIDYLNELHAQVANLKELYDRFYQLMNRDFVTSHGAGDENIRNVVFLVVDSFRQQAEAKGISIELIKPTNTFDKYSNPLLLRRVLVNLLGNAIKYSYTGRQIRLACEILSDRITIIVSDVGIGITELDRGRLYSEFLGRSREFNQVVINSQLPMRRILPPAPVEDGRVLIEDEVEKGSTFTVELPRA